MTNRANRATYVSQSYYDVLTKYEGEHEEGFNIICDPSVGGWTIEGDIKAFRKWLREEGLR